MVTVYLKAGGGITETSFLYLLYSRSLGLFLFICGQCHLAGHLERGLM